MLIDSRTCQKKSCCYQWEGLIISKSLQGKCFGEYDTVTLTIPYLKILMVRFRIILLCLVDSDNYLCYNVFLRCLAIKITVFWDYKNIDLICVIFVAVTYKDYHCQSDRLSCKLVLLYLGEAAVNEVFYWRFKFKCSFLFRCFSTWE